MRGLRLGPLIVKKTSKGDVNHCNPPSSQARQTSGNCPPHPPPATPAGMDVLGDHRVIRGTRSNSTYCDLTEQEAEPLELMQPEAQLTSVELPEVSPQTAFWPDDLHSPLLLPVLTV